MQDYSHLKSIDQMIEACQKEGRVEKNSPIEMKANENVDVTQNSTWYDASGIKNSIKDMTSERGALLSRLSEGYEGDNLPSSYPIPFDVTNYFMLGKSAWTDSARPAFSNTQVTDAKGTLTQVEFIIQFGITDKMIRHSTDKRLFDHVVGAASKAAVSSAEGCIINGDTETGGTGNVNSDDQAAATTFGSAQYHALKIDAGIRERAINGTGQTVDVGAFDSDDINSVRAALGQQYMGKASEQLLMFEPSTWLKAQTDDALKLAINNNAPTIQGGQPNPFGVEAISHDLVPLTQADGKQSATGSNNTLGQFLCVYKPAVRWGFGQNFNLEVERVQGYGFEVTGTMEFSFVILDSANTVSAGINVTV
jgi:hypothetical protein